MISADEKTCEVFVSGWWRDNFPQNVSHAIGAKKALSAVVSASLRNEAFEALERETRLREEAKSAADSPEAVARQRLQELNARRRGI